MGSFREIELQARLRDITNRNQMAKTGRQRWLCNTFFLEEMLRASLGAA